MTARRPAAPALAAALLCVALAAAAPGAAADDAADASSREAIERFEAYLARYPDSDSRAEVLFTLGQLHEEAETGKAMDATGPSGEIPDVVPHPGAIRCYSEVVDSFPKFQEREACLYRLGVVLMEAGERPRAEKRLEALLSESPSGIYAGPARLRLAELAESRGGWAAAARYYDEALASGVDPHREKLYYRRAWGLYKSADEAGAIATLRRGIALEESLGSDPDVGFFRETLMLLASLQSGVKGAAGWEEIAGGMRETAVRRRFLAELGMQLEDGDRALLALPVLDRALAEGPDHPDAPLVARAAIRAADKATLAVPSGRAAPGSKPAKPGAAGRGATDAAGSAPAAVAADEPITRRLRFEENYASGSAWRGRVTLPPEESQRIDEMCEQSLYEAGMLQYETARRDSTDAAAAAAAGATLRRAVERYPDSESKNDALFLVGELARGASDWPGAIAAYEATQARGLSKERNEALLYGRILAYDGLRAEAAAAEGEESEKARAAARAAGGAIDAYLAEFPNSPSLDALRRKRADLMAQSGDPAAAADRFRLLYEQAPLGTKSTRELAGLAGLNYARAGRYEEAAAWYDKANDPERAAAALYEGAQREAAAGNALAAGLALLELRARYPEVSVAGPAALDAIDLLSRAEATDTLIAWVATIRAPSDAVGAAAKSPDALEEAARTSGAAGDSLQRALVTAARRTETRDRAAAGRLYREAARFGGAEGATAALVASGEALSAAGRREDAAAALSVAIARFPREAFALPPTLFAADLLADSLGDAAAATSLLDKAAVAAKASTPGRHAAWRRRTAHALAQSGRTAEALVAFDRCLADTALFATGKSSKSGAGAVAPQAASQATAGGPAEGTGDPGAASADSLLFERETTLAALEKAGIVRAALPAPVTKKMTVAESKKLQAKTDEAVAAYAFAIGRGFRDLTSRAGHDAADALAGSAGAFLEAGIAGRDASHCESARRAAGRAVAFRAATAALPVEPPDEWMRRAAAGLDLRARLGTRLIAAVDSIAPSADAAGLTEKALSDRIVALDRHAEFLTHARNLALDDSSADLEARVALARGGYVERMGILLLAAPMPANLPPEGQAEYTNAVQAKAGEFTERAAGIYREALEHTGPAAASSAAVQELEQRLALLTASGRGRGD